MSDPRIVALVARYGWRISSLDAHRAGVPEVALFDAAARGEAKIERVQCAGQRHLVTTYLVFA